jgi:hypothetical protein
MRRDLHDFNADFLAEDMLNGSVREFWERVDSQQIRVCHCGPACRHYPQTWAAERGDQCIAAKGNGDRCSARIEAGPFCERHLERARTWFRALDIAEGHKIAASQVGISIEEARAAITQAQNVLWSTPDDLVYFWELDGQGLVKIGHSRRVEIRTAQFLKGKGCTFPDGADPSRGRLIGTTPGGEPMEKHLHRIYRREWISGEWFRLTDGLADDIARLVRKEAAA